MEQYVECGQYIFQTSFFFCTSRQNVPNIPSTVTDETEHLCGMDCESYNSGIAEKKTANVQLNMGHYECPLWLGTLAEIMLKCSSERQTHWTEGKMAMKETPVITFVFMCGIIMCWMDGKPPKLVRTLWQRDWQVIQKDCVASCPTVPKEHNAPLITTLCSSTSTASSGSPTGRRSLQWGWLSCPTSSVPAWPSTLGRRCGAWVGRLLVRKDIKLW